MGKMGSSIQSTMSGQMNPTNMQRKAYGSASPTSGYSAESANMPMAYGPGGTQTQRNPYMYQMYGGNQQQFAPGGIGQFGTMGQPSMGGYPNFMSSPLGQKFGMLMSPYRPTMNPAYGMQSYGQPAIGGEGTGSFQEAAQAASGADVAAGGTPAPAPARQQPDFLVPYSSSGYQSTPSRPQPLHVGSTGAHIFGGGPVYATQGGQAPRVIVDDKYKRVDPYTGERLAYDPMKGLAAANFYGGLNPYNEEFLYDPTSNTLYSPEAARQRFGY